MSQLDFIFSIIVLIFSIVVHEFSHGYMAYILGDNTAKHQGRLTLNPFKHLEWFGSFILPLITYLSGGFIIGWAKPVPFNPYNLKNQRWGEALVAIAGPMSNFIIALFFGQIIRFSDSLTFLSAGFSQSFLVISLIIVITNLFLMVFNLIPIPPLDGSKILFALFPNGLWRIRRFLEVYGSFLIIFVIFFLWQFVVDLVAFLFIHITGHPFL